MKVIGIVENDRYICEISHSEIEKFLDLYYGNKKNLYVGEEVNLGKGYDWYSKTQHALEKTEKFFQTNAETIDVITNAFLQKREYNEKI